MEFEKLYQSPNFEKNERIVKKNHDERCVCCNKPMKSSDVKYWVHMTTDWEMTNASEEELSQSGYESQGCFPVGSECAKKIDKKFIIVYN